MDSARIIKLAYIRLAWEQAGTRTAIFFADELDLYLLPKVGYEYTLEGTQSEVMTPDKIKKHIWLDAGSVSVSFPPIPLLANYRGPAPIRAKPSFLPSGD